MPPGTRRRQLLDGEEHRGRGRSATAAAASRYERLEPLPAAFPRVAGRPGRPGGDEAAALRPRRPGSVASASTRAVMIAGSTRAASPSTSGNEPALRRHDRHPGPHGLQRRESEAFIERGIGQHAGPRQQRRQIGRCRPSRADDPRPGRRRGDGRVERLLTPSRGPGEDECDIAWRPATRAERPHQPRQVLARLGRPDRQAEPARHQPGGAAAAPPRRRPRSGLGRSGMPGLTTRTRDGSAPKASITSSATKAESVWTQAPRRRARRINPG